LMKPFQGFILLISVNQEIRLLLKLEDSNHSTELKALLLNVTIPVKSAIQLQETVISVLLVGKKQMIPNIWWKQLVNASGSAHLVLLQMDTKTTFARLVTTLAQLVTTMVTSVMTNSVLSATMSSYSDSTNHKFALSSVNQVIINQVKTPVEDVMRLVLSVRVHLPDVPLVTQIIPETFQSFGTAIASTNALQAILLWRMHACLAKVPAPSVLEPSTIVKLATVPWLWTH
jgi:hypothetical protein